ncbi:hypothetical protein LCGC14_0745320 [marine sediment metagenome]|uniref:DNA methylase N-4/N-6 domain-containing protein n=1 Tax=marine sediment metagenome TaxID=412755 RepID=A0A0F9Q9R7_9ZZZZ
MELIQGDCIEHMSQMAAESVDLIIADPPYGIAYQSGHRSKQEREAMIGDYGNILWRLLPLVQRILKKEGAFYLFCRFDVSPDWWHMVGNYLRPLNKLIWVKNNWGMGDLKGNWASQYEEIIFAVKGRHLLRNGRPSNVLFADRIAAQAMAHPTEKPAALMRQLIEASTSPGDLILDPCCGVGPVLVAAEQTGRRAIGIEINPQFCDEAERRCGSNLVLRPQAVRRAQQ